MSVDGLESLILGPIGVGTTQGLKKGEIPGVGKGLNAPFSTPKHPNMPVLVQIGLHRPSFNARTADPVPPCHGSGVEYINSVS